MWYLIIIGDKLTISGKEFNMFFIYTSLYLAIVGVVVWEMVVKYKGKNM
jgi:hypothetical protein